MSTDSKRPTTSLVAGGAGFIGSHLCRRLLADDQRVICVDNYSTGSRRSLPEMQGLVLLDLDIVSRSPEIGVSVDFVYDLASPASPVAYQRDPIGTLRANSEGTLNLLRFAESHGARFLFASTSEVYGDPLVHPQPETYNGNVSATGPRSMYDESKRFGEALVTAFAAASGLQTRIARIFNTYGPGMRADDGRVISNFIVQVLNGDAVTMYGDGSQTRSFQYVSDLVEGIVRLMASDYDRPVNLGNPEEVSIIDLARRISHLTGRELCIDWRLPAEGDPQRRRPDIDLAMRLLGWRPEVALVDGLRRTVAWFQEVLQEDSATSTGHVPSNLDCTAKSVILD